MRTPSAAARSFRHPCTGPTRTRGFASFLERELAGPRANIRAFARELGEVFGPRHVTLVNSGSSANLAAALALAEVAGPGEAVVCGLTFPTTAAALKAAGFDLKVVDCAPGGFCMDPGRLKEALGPRTKVVAVTHFLGFAADLPAVRAIADHAGLLVLQDACETMGLSVSGRPAHEWGDLSTWSFYHPHHLSSFGGGAVVSPDASWRRLVESYSHWGRECSCHYAPEDCPVPAGPDHQFTYGRAGFNLELSELNAAFGRFSLRTWPSQEEARKRRYAVLFEALKDLRGLKVYAADPSLPSPFVFPVTTLDGRAPEAARALAKAGIEVRSLMGGLLTRQAPFRELHHAGLRNCAAASKSTFFLGIHQTLAESDVKAAAAEVRRLLSR
ncbi:MAG: aminotransferase class I/II-fold pyridoxal phosphate-dependent enzyme [Elusimicrobia bacterium]|nr:aminotransferase class I/II-fold pyridoxal phosphate-dependent enzyme [Elusimicrobiota bacterium]